MTLSGEARMAWKRLDWDSEQFGFPAARLENVIGDAASLGVVLDDCRGEGIRHLVARVDAHERGVIRILEQAGFELLDGIRIFELELENVEIGDSPGYCEVRPFREEDREQVLAIARTSFTYDRFHADSALAPGVADRVNETWVDNCCAGLMADVVFVASQARIIRGFVSCSIDDERGVGAIGMVAVDRSARRQGVARAITLHALHWFRERRAATVEVGTQLANIPATHLYRSVGFLPSTLRLTFRKML